MMQDWLLAEVRAAEDRGNKRRQALQTEADAKAYVQSAQERIRQCFGPLPEKTPLNAKVTKVLERDGYRIECVTFESRPGFVVTGNLYVPTGRQQPLPGVIGLCGHSFNGKAAEPYQSFAQGLGRLGYVTFIIDPIGQGERYQLLEENHKSRLGAGVDEHLQIGNQQTLIGEFLGTWFAWDGIRALDYLLTRPEVDPQRVGVTGNSGGGTQAAWLCGLEPRFTMAGPACFITTLRRNAENELPADIEQCPPRLLALDLDHSDFIAAMAPKPVIILSQEKDFFDTRGAAEAFGRLEQLYRLLGKPENIQLQVGPDPHGYSKPNREAMYRFFNKITGVSHATTEPPITIEKDEVLWCTPTGQVADLPSRAVTSFTRETAQALAAKQIALKGEPLQKALRDRLKVKMIGAVEPDYRILRSVGDRKYPAKTYCCYAVKTDPQAPVEVLLTRLSNSELTSRLPSGKPRAFLYVSHRSVDEELRSDPFLKELIAAEPDAEIFACDVRGIGDSQPNTCGADQFLKPYGSHYFYAAYGLMLDRPLLGQRVDDVIRILKLLETHREIHLAGKGWGALVAALAAVLSPQVGQVTLKNAPSSFHEIAINEDYRWPLAALPPGVLKDFDLPDCYAELASRNFRNLDPWGAMDGMS